MDQAGWLDIAGTGGHVAWEHANRLGLPLVDMTRILRNIELRKLLPKGAGRRLHATPLLSSHGYLAVAIDANADEVMVSTLGFVTNQPIIPLVATTEARLGQSGPLDDRDDDRWIAKTDAGS